MRLVCPSCGAVASAEAWENDAEARAALSIVAALPTAVGILAVPYLGLFRPRPMIGETVGSRQSAVGSGQSAVGSGRSLTWKRAARLLADLRAQVEAPDISWGQAIPRPNPPQAWAQAMEKLLARPPKELPLTGHNYLRRMAYAIADEMDARGEAQGAKHRAQSEIRRDIEEVTEEKYVEGQRRVRELLEGIGKRIGEGEG